MPEKSLLQSDEFTEAVNSVKASAVAMAALAYEPKLNYSAELLDILSTHLYEAADYFESIIADE